MGKLKDAIIREKAEHSAIADREIELAETQRFQFDPVEHVYTLDGRPMHGVTSILRVIAKPALIQWAANCAVDFIENGIRENLTDFKSGRLSDLELFYEALCKEARVAHRKKKEDAGAKGSDVHEIIEDLVKFSIEHQGGRLANVQTELPDGRILNPQVQKFIAWATESNVRFIESEKRVYSQESWYAGCLDLILEMNGKKYIADVKTSSAIYPEFYLQMAAYQGALEEMNEHTDIAGAMVINLPKKGGFEIGMNFAYDDNRLAFLAALVLYRTLNALTK